MLHYVTCQHILFIFILICCRHPDTLDHMTTATEMRNNAMKTLQFLVSFDFVIKVFPLFSPDFQNYFEALVLCTGETRDLLNHTLQLCVFYKMPNF